MVCLTVCMGNLCRWYRQKAQKFSLEQLLLQPLHCSPHSFVLTITAGSFLGLMVLAYQLPRSLQMRSGNQTLGALFMQFLRSIWCFNNLKTSQKLVISENSQGISNDPICCPIENIIHIYIYHTVKRVCIFKKEGLFYFSLVTN